MAMVPLMEKEIVDRRSWISREDFLDIMAVSQAMPGVFAVNMASHIGYKIAGFRGAIMASAGTIFPSLIIILPIAIAFARFKDNPYVEAIFKGIRPAVVALITLPVFTMAQKLPCPVDLILIAVGPCPGMRLRQVSMKRP